MIGDNDRLLVLSFNVHDRSISFMVGEVDREGFALIPNNGTVVIKDKHSCVTKMYWSIKLNQSIDIEEGQRYQQI